MTSNIIRNIIHIIYLENKSNWKGQYQISMENYFMKGLK